MKLLLDTNIIVDILSQRSGYEESLEVMRFCEAKIAVGFITTATVLDVMYILRKHINPENVREAVQTLLTILDLEEIKKADVTGAFEGGMTDYEDAVQAMCAKRCNADYIVTRNVHDFTKAPMPALLPNDILGLLRSGS